MFFYTETKVTKFVTTIFGQTSKVFNLGKATNRLSKNSNILSFRSVTFNPASVPFLDLKLT